MFQDNNLQVALTELQEAAKLAPANAVIRYNLAIVRGKTDEPFAAVQELQQAISLGLPDSLKSAAEDLRIELTYAVQKRRQAMIGNWEFHAKAPAGLEWSL